jgi:hypothetical protein
MSLPRGRGRIITVEGQATIVASCPLCGGEHRYQKGDPQGDEIVEIKRRGFTEEWLPCQFDLPGNFWRIAVTGGKGRDKAPSKRRAGGRNPA